MKKIFLIFLLLLCTTGCVNNHAEDAVKEYLEKYKNHDQEIINSTKELLREENLTQEQNNIYELIMKKQYTELEYQIKEEFYNGRKAVVRVELTVYDYNHSKEKALEEKKNTETKNDYINLQLKNMKEETERVKYTVDFFVNLKEKNWVLETPNTEVLEKIHGLYNEEED